jgi:hypothetical protein
LYLSCCPQARYEQTAVQMYPLLDAAVMKQIMEQSVEVVQAYVANKVASVCQ